MSVIIKEVKSSADYKAFVQFQFDLYQGNEFWVPPIFKDEVKAIQRDYNPAFQFCATKFWLALRGGKVVGRIGAIVNQLALEKEGENVGRFTRSEFIDDNEVVDLLFSTAEKWLLEQGMRKVQGPLGFTNLDHQGMLIEGFDHLPSAASEYHLPYYKDQLIRVGYEKEIDWVEFRLFIKEVPEKAQRVADMMVKRNKLQVRHFESTKELEPYAKKLFSLFNEAFSELFSVIPLNDEMVDYYINRYLTLMNPKFVKLVFDQEDKLVAFIIGLPSLSEALQKAKGRIFPFGWWHLRKALKHPKVVDLMLTGITPEYQGKGVAAILINELQKVMLEHGVKDVETTGIFETNTKAIQNWKNYDHIQHKRKRCWKKTLR
ncbi:GNAT family N-acetyltransferase [Parvicella tangerina]|uniref:Protein YghO n=1 Tax=Parvicella tangerina TaxID=2829795 RepID=A0A916JJP4_9FLAO|nr:GNAT family N-acetyltransferase [Parvicella tangerina]CAG5077274.1 Protein YghO [Parvicella tangerina]